ncbi:MAG: replication initiation factor domain-containing protein [Methylophilaceae bacterium]|nr:replication initiation factor domain-containing protein [Methylophilaceae bacterium]
MKSDKTNPAFNNTAFGSKIWADASAPPKSSNEGGSTASEYAQASQASSHPRLVIRGESFNNTDDNNSGESSELCTFGGKAVLIATPLPKSDGEPYAAITDFLNCSFSFKEYDLDELIFDLLNCLGPSFSPLTHRFKGLHGWEHSIQLGESKTFLAYGGQNNTAFLSIPGEACHMMPSWAKLVKLLRDKLNAKITRWDGAVDDYHGLHTVDSAVELYKSGAFNAGGKRPTCDQRGNWLIPDGSGRTFYVGKRENGKMLRVYEKGMQLGQQWSSWVRWEIELHSVDRIIPWDVLIEPGKYVAGAYPKATSWIQEEMSRVRTIQNTTRISYDYMVANTSISCGKQLNVMLEIEGSAENVLNKLIRDGIPKRLDIPIVDQNEGWEK